MIREKAHENETLYGFSKFFHVCGGAVIMVLTTHSNQCRYVHKV